MCVVDNRPRLSRLKGEGHGGVFNGSDNLTGGGLPLITGGVLIIYLGLLVLIRKKVADHDGLIAAFTIIGVWLYALSQLSTWFATPTSYYANATMTGALVVFSLTYILRRKHFRPIGAKRMVLKSGGSLGLLTLTALSLYESELVFYGIRDFSSFGIDLLKFLGLAFAGGFCLVALIFLNGWQKYLRGNSTPPTPVPRVATPSSVISAPYIQTHRDVIQQWLAKMGDALPKARELVDSHKAQTQVIFLDRFRSVLADIPYPTVAPWSAEMRQMVSQVIDFIASLLPPKWVGYEERCFEWIATLLRTNDPPTRELLKTRFLPTVTLYLRESRFEFVPTPLYLFQELNSYDTEPMMDLVKAALDEGRVAIGDGWSDDRFKKMHQNIRFEDMSLRNPQGYRKVVDYLYEQMKVFDGSTNLVAYEKAKMLWERASQRL